MEPHQPTLKGDPVMLTTTTLQFSYTSATLNLMVRAVSFTKRADNQPDIHRVRIIKDESDYFLSFNDPADALVEAQNVAKDFATLMLDDLHAKF
jgi:hypothetical protein